jgi:hypothetical protein
VAAVIGAATYLAAALVAALPLTSSASFDSATPNFADRVTATATVVVDGGEVDPGSVRAVGGFGPLEVLSGPDVERHDLADGRTAIDFRWVVACLDEDCLPAGATRTIALPPLRLSGTGADGNRASAVVRWPALRIAGRVSREEAGEAIPPLRRQLELPEASYRVSPDELASVLRILAALLLGAAGLIGARALLRTQRRRREQRLARLTPVERALLYARESEARAPADRRRALGLLGRVLGGSESALGDQASTLAWAPPEPSADQVVSVVDDVEREIVR